MWGPRRRSDGTDHRGELGRRGEDEAARYLRSLGYRIVGRRERVLRGDIDIVALDDRCVVFVEVRSRQGWYVVEPSFEEAQETYAARRVLESGMLRDAGRPLQAAIRTLREHVAQERGAIAEADNAGQRSVLLADFHVCLAEQMGNRFLTAMMADLSARTTLVSALYQSQTEAQHSNADHEAIVDALAAGDMARAEQLMREHIDALAARLDQNLAHRARLQDRLLDALQPQAAQAAQATRTGRGKPRG